MKFVLHLSASLFRAFPENVVDQPYSIMRPIMVRMGLDPEMFYHTYLPSASLHVVAVTDAGLGESKKLCLIVKHIIQGDPTFLMAKEEIMYDPNTISISRMWHSIIIQTARFVETILGGTVKYGLEAMWVYGDILGDSIDLDLSMWIEESNEQRWIHKFLPSYRRRMKQMIHTRESARERQKAHWNLLWDLAH